jgi:hypothetical protein
VAVAWLVLNAVVFTRIEPAILMNEVPAGLSSLSATTCKTCHPAAYADWSGSMMAGAMTEPVFLADYVAKGEPFLCLRCHAPLQQQRPQHVVGLLSFDPLVPVGYANATFDADLQREGVTCAACHLRDGAMVGPSGASAPHRTRKGDVDCARCHQLPEASPAIDLALSDTHGEHERWGGDEGCVDCHAPHRFPGAWDDDTVRRAVELISATATAAGVEVVIHNRAGHSVPTGDLARALVVRAGDAEVVMQGVTSLLPGETRTIALPATGAVEVVFERLRSSPHADVVPASRRHVVIARAAVSEGM